MSYFSDTISKQGENLSYYAHSYESSRNSTTNLKVSLYAAATTIVGVVRSQPNTITYGESGVFELEIILVLTKTAVAEKDVIKWNNRYYDVELVEDVYWNKRGSSTLQYYKCRCVERIEFLGN